MGLALSRWKLVCMPLAALLVLFMTMITIGARGTGDVGIWSGWTANIHQHGLIAGYGVSRADYPPLAHAVLAINAGIASALGWNAHWVFKLSLWLCLLVSAMVMWAWSRSFAAALLMYAACMVNALSLGYLDIYFVAPLLLAWMAFSKGNHRIGCLLFSLACMVKWQPIIVAPLLLLYLIRLHGPLRQFRARDFLVDCVVPAAIPPVLLAMIFGVPEMMAAFGKSLDNLAFSGQAMNLAWISTWLIQWLSPESYGALVDGKASVIRHFSEGVWFRGLFFAVYITVIVLFLRRKGTFEWLLLCSIAGFCASFILNTGVHENHLMVPMLLSMMLWVMDRRYRLVSAYLIIMSNANMLAFYSLQGHKHDQWRVMLGMDITVILAMVNMAAFLYLLKTLWLMSGSRPAHTG